jgi:NTE family protein
MQSFAEHFLKPNNVRKLYKTLENANNYHAWYQAALELDQLEGMYIWKTDPDSTHYQHGLIRERLYNLRNWRKTNNWAQLIFSLREGLHRNLGNLSNPELYKHAHVGTKLLIDDYISEVVSLLNYVCDHDIPELPYPQKLLFFRHTGQSFGRSALMLSGGANLGMFHIGVIKALHEQNLLPRVISGSSAGAVAAAFLGTRKDSELPALYRCENITLNMWKLLNPSDMVRLKSLMDVSQLEKFLRENIGEYTFEEAFRRTKRIINITVSPVDKNQQPRLLNYLTTPHMLIWSAVLASCSVPGLFPPVKLTTKDKEGREIPYLPTISWVDGAIQSDLPSQRLGELYNVNHHIVSQTNPHILPFMTDQAKKEGWSTFLTDLAKREIQFHSKQALNLASFGLESGLVKGFLDGAAAIVDQNYYGDVTVHPHVGALDYLRVLGNLTKKEFLAWVLAGERATWPKISMIRDQTVIGQTLEDCILRLKKQRGRRSAEDHHEGETEKA